MEPYEGMPGLPPQDPEPEGMPQDAAQLVSTPTGGLAVSRMDAGYVRWAQDFQWEIERLKMAWRGKEIRRAPNGKKVVENVGVPLMSESGIYRLSGILSSIVTKNSYLSNLSPERVNEICLDSCSKIAIEMAYRAEEWSIRPESFETIVVEISNLIELALRRALGDRERNWVQNVVVVHEQRAANEEKPRGLLGYMPFGRR
jgi:hypothetical protein